MSMLKSLLKKQFMEVNTWLLQNKKTGKRRSNINIAMLIVAYTVLFLCLGMIFFGTGYMLCEPLVFAGLGWLYFSIMGLMAVMLGVFGSVFNTYATLYKAKDNELLLSMPIPPSRILAARLFGVWMWSLIYEAIVFVPALIVYWLIMNWNGGLTLTAVLFGILLFVLLSVFILTLSCILGWVVAKIGGKLKNKSIVTVLISLVFIALYYFCYSKAYMVLQSILQNAQTVGQKVKGAAYPLYLLGRSGEGDVVSMLLFTLIIVAVFAVVYLIMSRSFIKMATSNKGVKRVKYKEKDSRVRSINEALLFKEIKRFVSSAVYMLNCGLGTILLPVLGIFILIKADMIQSIIASYMGNDSSLVVLIACAGLCVMASMNDITAPSISLEGKSLWIIQSLPVPAWRVLLAKLKMHLLITEIPMIFCSVCTVIALRPQLFTAILLFVMPMLFVLLSAAFGLMVNLKMPNLSWTDETVPVKQSMGVLLSLFGGWGLVIVIGILYFLIHAFVSAEIFLLICTALIGILCTVIILWLKNKGTVIFEKLG